MSRRRSLTALAAALVAAVLAGCGGSDPQEVSEPADLAPPDAPIYLEANVRPEGEQLDAIEALAERIAGIQDPGAPIIEQLDQSGSVEDPPITYSEDIEPWLGERAGLFIGSLGPSDLDQQGNPTQFAAMIESTDDEAAQELVDRTAERSAEETSYEGVDYLVDDEGMAAGLVDGFVVFGAEDSFEAAVDAAGGDSLAASAEYAEDVESLSEEPLATAYVDPGAALDASVAAGETTENEAEAARALFGSPLKEPVVAGVFATPDFAAFELSLGDPGTAAGATDLLAELPADAWFSYGVADAGAYARRSLAQLESLGSSLGGSELQPGAIARGFRRETGLELERDVLSTIGDVAFYLRGAEESEIQLGARIETTDERGAARAVAAARRAAGQSPTTVVGPPLDRSARGFSAGSRFGEGFIDVQLGEGTVELVAAASRASAAAEAPTARLGVNDAFAAAEAALGTDYRPALFLALPGLLDAVEANEDGLGTEYLLAKPYLDSLAYLAAGSTVEGERLVARVVLGIGD